MENQMTYPPLKPGRQSTAARNARIAQEVAAGLNAGIAEGRNQREVQHEVLEAVGKAFGVNRSTVTRALREARKAQQQEDA